MGILNKMRGGADLSKPSATAGWMIPAFFGVIILGVVAALALYTLNSAKTVVPGLSAVTEGARTYMS